jgi:hypothetical protein
MELVGYNSEAANTRDVAGLHVIFTTKCCRNRSISGSIITESTLINEMFKGIFSILEYK